MKNPFTVCCGISYLNSNMRNPPDAEKLSDDEAKFYIDNLKGSIQLFHFATISFCFQKLENMFTVST